MEEKYKEPLEYEKVSKLLTKYAIPSIIAMLVSALYNIVDQIFIGQGVGVLGNAATNVTFPLTTICTAIALLLGIGGASKFIYSSINIFNTTIKILWLYIRNTTLCTHIYKNYINWITISYNVHWNE